MNPEDSLHESARLEILPSISMPAGPFPGRKGLRRHPAEYPPRPDHSNQRETP